jgi:NAD(P)-dependent dehydrogenase (short-subunit alcohol dehydrogenase family)
MGRVQGKVAFISGAARGQGRGHAVRLAEEGADIIAMDFCTDLAAVNYPMARPEDLEETARLVEKAGQRAVIVESGVRERAQVISALDTGLAEFGKLDIVGANAGIAAMTGEPALQVWSDTIDTNLGGVINVVQAALPHLGAGASIIATGSTAAFTACGTFGRRSRRGRGLAPVSTRRSIDCRRSVMSRKSQGPSRNCRTTSESR